MHNIFRIGGLWRGLGVCVSNQLDAMPQLYTIFSFFIIFRLWLKLFVRPTWLLSLAKQSTSDLRGNICPPHFRYISLGRCLSWLQTCLRWNAVLKMKYHLQAVFGRLKHSIKNYVKDFSIEYFRGKVVYLWCLRMNLSWL